MEKMTIQAVFRQSPYKIDVGFLSHGDIFNQVMKKIITAVVILLIVVLIAFGIKHFFFTEPPISYLSVSVTRMDVEEAVLATGALEPVKQVNVGAQVNGQLTEDVAWSGTAVTGVYRFLKKVWTLFDKVDLKKTVGLTHDEKVIINKAIQNVRDRVLSMKFNTAISALMELSNHMAEMEKIPFEMYREFIKLLSIFAPYICDEIWEKLGNETFLINEKFPDVDEKFLKTEMLKIPVSVNGKTRAVIDVKFGTGIDVLTKIATENPAVKKHIAGEVKKIIATENKFINIIV